jgi:hypothetical protein
LELTALNVLQRREPSKAITNTNTNNNTITNVNNNTNNNTITNAVTKTITYTNISTNTSRHATCAFSAQGQQLSLSCCSPPPLDPLPLRSFPVTTIPPLLQVLFHHLSTRRST